MAACWREHVISDAHAPPGSRARIAPVAAAAALAAVGLLLATVDADRVAKVLGSLSAAMKQKLNDCLKAALGLP